MPLWWADIGTYANASTPRTQASSAPRMHFDLIAGEFALAQEPQTGGALVIDRGQGLLSPF